MYNKKIIWWRFFENLTLLTVACTIVYSGLEIIALTQGNYSPKYYKIHGHKFSLSVINFLLHCYEDNVWHYFDHFDFYENEPTFCHLKK